MEPIHILLVEDNEGDIMLTEEAFEAAHMKVRLSIAKDGKQAIDLIDRTSADADGWVPDLVLLDLNLPKIGGHEVLKYIKEKQEIRKIPVIMLTTSSSQRDIYTSYYNHANCYITKPLREEDFVSLIATIRQFWFSTVILPTRIPH